MNMTCSWAIAAYGKITARQSKFQRRTIGAGNNEASLEVRSSITRYGFVYTSGNYKPALRSYCLLKTNPVQEWMKTSVAQFVFCIAVSPLTSGDTFLTRQRKAKQRRMEHISHKNELKYPILWLFHVRQLPATTTFEFLVAKVCQR